MFRRVLFLGLIAYFVTLTARADSKSIVIGHNVTPTTEVVKGGDWTVGNYAVGYGLTDHLFLATSPWIWVSYNTANVHLKYAGEVSERARLGFFASYFESYESDPLLTEINGSGGSGGGCRPGQRNCQPPSGSNPVGTDYRFTERYQWQSISTHALASYRFDAATVYLSLKYSYFWNDDMPYSIRMDPGSDDIRDQWDFTSLTTVPLSELFLLNIELGGLGLNYEQPYLQMGMSVAYKSESWLVQLGASYTAQFRELGEASAWAPGRYDTRLHYSQSENEYYYFRYLQTALHPEIQIQYFF